MHSPKKLEISFGNEVQQNYDDTESDKLKQSCTSSVSNNHLIPDKASTSSTCTALLVIFGCLVLLGAIAAIVVSVLLNTNKISSDCSGLFIVRFIFFNHLIMIELSLVSDSTTAVNSGTSTSVVSTTVSTTSSSTTVSATGLVVL